MPGSQLLGRRRQRDAAMELLVRGVVCADPLDDVDRDRLLAEAPVEELLWLADYHGVAGMAYEALRTSLHPGGELFAQLKSRYDRAVIGHMRVIHGLATIRTTLEAAGCGWVVIKGPALVEGLYAGRPGRRAYRDLDLLVDPAGFADALDALDGLGATLLDRNWTVLRRDMRGEVHLLLPSGVLIDLHWNLINMYRGRMNIDTSEVLARRRHLDADGVGIPCLAAEDAILHLALHAALSGGDRLLWLKDLERAVAIWQPSWELVMERADRWRIGAPVGLMLGRARDVLGAEIPHNVTDRLIGGGMRRVARWIDRVSPWQYGMGRLAAPTRLMARSVGMGTLGAPAWILWRTIRNLDRGQERRSLTFTPRGDDRDRRAFVEAVVAVGRESRRR